VSYGVFNEGANIDLREKVFVVNTIVNFAEK
jgi:hypothetical protein